MSSINKTHTQHNAVNKTLTYPFKWGGVFMVLCVLAGVCSPVWAKSPSVVPDLDGQAVILTDASTATLVKTKQGYSIKNRKPNNDVLEGYTQDAQGNSYKLDVTSNTITNITLIKPLERLQKDCDKNSDGHIKGIFEKKCVLKGKNVLMKSEIAKSDAAIAKNREAIAKSDAAIARMKERSKKLAEQAIDNLKRNN